MLLLHNTPEYASALKNAYRQFPAKGSALDIDFINNRQRVAGTQGAALDGITFTRSTTGTYFDSAGVLQTAAINAPRYEYDPVSLRPLGLLREPSRANSIRNNTMQGAVAGTPGTLPTNWNTAAAGLTTSVTGVGTEAGVNYVDLRISGTPTGTLYQLYTDSANVIAASEGQAWTGTAWVSLRSGSMTGISLLRLTALPRTAALATLASSNTTLSPGATLTRYAVAHTAPANTAYLQLGFWLSITVGVPVDVTLRIGMPQLELGSGATSVIPTTGTAATRGADVISMTGADFSKWYTAGEGTLFVRSIPRGVVGTAPMVELDDGTGNEVICVRGNGANPELYIVDGGVTQAQIDAGTLTANTATNIAAVWAANDAAISQNGNPVETDTSVTLPTVTQMLLGSDGTNYANTYMTRVMYWPKRLPNHLLQYLSRLTA